MSTINFRQAKKRLERARKSDAAAQNAAKFGRTKVEKDAERTAKDKARAHLDQHKLEK